MKSIRLIMALHSHQPVGNFESVFRKGVQLAYQPFLNAIDEFPEIRWALHYSGPLWEWLERHDKMLVERVVAGVRSGCFELMGSGLGEPILTMLSRDDAVGQVISYRRHLDRRYGIKPRGVWLTERIWEQSLTNVLAAAGVEYTVLDDFHFKVAGLRERDLNGYFITEDQGRKLKLFAGSEFLRYSIPFRNPEDTIEYLRTQATDDGRNVIVYGDDGEKFGLWPETHRHVFENGWLQRFLKMLHDNREWIKFTTFSEVIDTLPPVGRIYLSDCSYREMTEWSLPVSAQEELEHVMKDLDQCHMLDRARPFIRGGSWRNFKVKFLEAAQMYARQAEVSQLLGERSAAKAVEEARYHLFMGQCNCAYWHGVFGGLYMPFLRFAVYSELIQAENLLAGKREHPNHVEQDFDLDGRPEIRLRNEAINAYFKPDRGGTLYELDDRPKAWNLTAVMTRRKEVYHRKLVEAVQRGVLTIVTPEGRPASQGAVSIHDMVRAKEPGLEGKLFYDTHVRDSFVDHFFPASVGPDQLLRSESVDCGDFVSAPYEMQVPRGKACAVTFTRQGTAGAQGRRAPVWLSKRMSLAENVLEARYVLSFPEGCPAETLFAVELNIGLMAGASFDRNYFSHTRENLGNLSTMLQRPAEPALALIDDHLGLELWVRVSPEAGFWTYPVETVNESEGGFERVYQGSAILPWWRLKAAPGEEQVLTVSLEVKNR